MQDSRSEPDGDLYQDGGSEGGEKWEGFGYILLRVGPQDLLIGLM